MKLQTMCMTVILKYIHIDNIPNLQLPSHILLHIICHYNLLEGKKIIERLSRMRITITDIPEESRRMYQIYNDYIPFQHTI